MEDITLSRATTPHMITRTKTIPWASTLGMPSSPLMFGPDSNQNHQLIFHITGYFSSTLAGRWTTPHIPSALDQKNKIRPYRASAWLTAIVKVKLQLPKKPYCSHSYQFYNSRIYFFFHSCFEVRIWFGRDWALDVIFYRYFLSFFWVRLGYGFLSYPPSTA